MTPLPPSSQAKGYSYTIPVAPADRLPLEGETIYSRARVADYKIDPETGCWIWQKFLLRGYPQGGAKGKPHRVYWARANGPIPDGAEIHHQCRTTACINPAHLEAIHPRTHDVIHFLGERAGGLSVSDVAEIRRLGAVPGTRAVEVAAQYGIHDQTVRRYWRGIRWQPEGLGGVKVMAAGRACERCGGDIPVDRARHAIFCSTKCQHSFNERKRRAERKAAAA